MLRMEISGNKRLFVGAVSENIVRVVYTGRDEVQNHSCMVEHPEKVSDLQKEEREGKEHFQKLDMADYAKKSFGMFGGKEQTVKLLVHNSLAGVIIDRFGKDIMMIPEDEQYFTVNVDVHISRQFLGWVFSLGEQVRILKPDEVVVEMKKEIKRLNQQYQLIREPNRVI